MSDFFSFRMHFLTATQISKQKVELEKNIETKIRKVQYVNCFIATICARISKKKNNIKKILTPKKLRRGRLNSSIAIVE